MLKVEGVNPDRIKCVAYGERQRVDLNGITVADLNEYGPSFDGRWTDDDFRRDAQAVMAAAFDAWRASGGTRLWPEPPPEPVDCVCGAKARVAFDSRHVIVCNRTGCVYAAYSVAEWNPMQATLKALKGAKS